MLAAVIARPQPAWAEELRCGDKIPVEVRTVVIDGQKGSFVPKGSMNRILFVLEECVPSYEALIAQQSRALEITTVTASVAIEAAGTWAQEERARGLEWAKAYATERTAREAMWREPAVWLGTGFVVGALATIAIASVIKRHVEAP